MTAVVAVLEADGPLGSSVCRSLSQTFEIRALMRDIQTPSAHALRTAGIQTMQVNYNNPTTFDTALCGVHGCFAITLSDYQTPDGYEIEIEEGKIIADALQRNNVNHVVYSTQLSVLDIIGVKCRHMDAKARIEHFMKQIGLPLTSIILPCFYEHLTMAPLKPCRVDQNGFYFEIPMGHTPLNLISIEDVGDVVAQVFSNGSRFINKSLSLSGDKMTIKDMAALFTTVLEPKFFKDRQVTASQFRNRNIPGADDLANMFEFFCRVDQRTNIDLTKQLNPGARSLKEWFIQNQNAVHRAMDTPDDPNYKAMMAL